VDAVEIIPILKKIGEVSKLVVVKQWRPPTGNYIIELPAGLVDAKENPMTAALRELREEAGYVGKVIDAEDTIETIFGMANSNTTSQMISGEIDGNLAENLSPQKELGEGEFTEVILIPMDKIMTILKDYKQKGCGIDGKIWLLAYGMHLQNNL